MSLFANRAGQVMVGLILIYITGCATFDTYESVKLATQSVTQTTPNRILLEPFKYYPADDYWCGPSVLASLLDYHQVTFDYQQLINQVYTPGKKGTYLHDLKAATRSYGLLPLEGPRNLNSLLQILAEGYPVITLENSAFSWWPRWHYRLIIGYDKTNKRLYALQADHSITSMKMVNFVNSWEKSDFESLLVVTAQQIPPHIQAKELISEFLTQKELNHFSNAEPILKFVLKQWPTDSLVQFTAANNAYDKGQYKTASKHYQAALQYNSSFSEAYINWAYTLHHLGCKEASNSALSCAETILNSQPSKLEQFKPIIQELKQLTTDTPTSQCPVLPNCN